MPSSMTKLLLTALFLAACGLCQSACLPTCPEPFQQLYPTRPGSCPCCWLPCDNNCGPKFANGYCCGGTTGVVCPALACTRSTAIAISGANGCAQAYSTVSSSSNSMTVYQLKSMFKSVFGDICTEASTTSTSGVTPAGVSWTEEIQKFSKHAEQAVAAVATATASIVSRWSAYACTCAGCSKSPCSAPANTAKANLDTQIAAFAQACAQAMTQAISELTAMGCWADNADIYAFSAATAIAQDIQTVLKRVTKEATSYDAAGCSMRIKGSYSDKTCASAIACSVSQVVAAIYSKQYTTSVGDLAGTGNGAVNTDAFTITQVDSCSSSVALAGITFPADPVLAVKTCLLKFCSYV